MPRCPHSKARDAEVISLFGTVQMLGSVTNEALLGGSQLDLLA